MDKIELTGSSDCLSDSYAFHKQPDGSYMHDSVYPAVFTLAAPAGTIFMVVWRDGRPLHNFRLRFGAESEGEGTVMREPCQGVKLECDVSAQSCGEEEEDDLVCGSKFMVVDRIWLA